MDERYYFFYYSAEAGTFTAAAERAGRTQSAISQAVSRLEKELGVPLFYRRKQGVSLTREGEVLFAHVNQAYSSLQAARRTLENLSSGLAGTLTLSAGTTISCYLLPPVLRSFQNLYPDINIVLKERTSRNVLKSVAAGEDDLGLAVLDSDYPGIISQTLVRREDVLVFSSRDDLRHSSEPDAKLLSGKKWITLDKNSRSGIFIDQYFQSRGIQPAKRLISSHLETIKKLIEYDMGVSILPWVTVREEVAAGKLYARSLEQKGLYCDFSLVLPKGRPPLKAAACFEDVLWEHIEQNPHLFEYTKRGGD